MKRASLALCAVGAFAALLAGCKSLDLGLDLGLSGVDAVTEARVVDGSPETVGLMLAASLKQKGFEVNVVKTGDTTVVESKTVAGLSFALVLKSQPGPNGREQTHVAMQWRDSRKDQQTTVQVFTEIDKQTKK